MQYLCILSSAQYPPFPETKEILLVKKYFWLVPQSGKLALVSGPVIVEANVKSSEHASC